MKGPSSLLQSCLRYIGQSRAVHLIRQARLHLRLHRQSKQEPQYLQSPALIQATTANFTSNTSGITFQMPAERYGICQATVEVEHPVSSSNSPHYLQWTFQLDPLANPFGDLEYAVTLHPGRHQYHFYLPARAGMMMGQLRLLSSTGDGWQLTPTEPPLMLSETDTSTNRTIVRSVSFQPAPSRQLPLPSYILLPVTSYCNYKCVMCEHGIDAVPDRAHYPDALTDQMIAYLNHAQTSHRVALTGLGESLMSPVFYRIVDSVRNPLVRFHFCSNAAMLTEKRIQWILSSPFTSVNVSLDAASAEIYHKIRRADWQRVVRNLEAFADALTRSGRTDLRLVLNMTLMKENLSELKQFIDLARHLRATAYINQLHCYEHHKNWVVDHPDFHFRYIDQVLHQSESTEQQIQDAHEHALKLGVSFRSQDMMRPLLDETSSSSDTPRDTTQPRADLPISQCPYPWAGDDHGTAVIAADGHVQMCCLQSPIGRVTEHTSVIDIWNGPVARSVRLDMMAGNIPQPCAAANCWYVVEQRKLDHIPGRVSLPLLRT